MQFLTSVLTNDPKGELGGTTYLSAIMDGNTTLDSVIWSITDQVSNNQAFKNYVGLYERFQTERQTRLKQDNATSVEAKQKQIQERLESAELSNTTQEFAKAIIKEQQDYILKCQQKGDTKFINSLVGKVLKEHKQAEPLLIKKYIEGLINV